MPCPYELLEKRRLRGASGEFRVCLAFEKLIPTMETGRSVIVERAVKSRFAHKGKFYHPMFSAGRPEINCELDGDKIFNSCPIYIAYMAQIS